MSRARADRGKVFGIGLNKTGTRSLAQATRLLGLRTLHKGDAATSALVDAASEAGEPLLSRVGTKWDAYFDVEGLVRRFALLDEQYPGARFILTTRDEDAWLESRRRHVEANWRRRYSGSFNVVDVEAWRADRATHHAAVAEYFQGHDNLLTFDVTDGWEPLATFLERPVPNVAFPWENRDGEGTYSRGLGAAGRFTRRVDIGLRRWAAGRSRAW